MEDRNTLRGQGFTLMVFAGLVVLCSVFFILGMVVGRGQAPQQGAGELGGVSAGAPETVAAGAEEDLPPELDFYEAVTADDPEPSAPRTPPSPTPPVPAAQPVSEPPGAPGPAADVALILQLGAFGTREAADRMVAQAREADFSAFVLEQSGSSLYRVQMGPYTSEAVAAGVRTRLEAAGFEVTTVR